MARKSNSDKLSTYRKKLDYSKKWIKQDNYHETWKRLINLYRGKHFKAYGDYDRMLVNIAFSTINVLYPSVSIGRPKIVVSPRTPDDADKAIIVESIINYWWQHYHCQEEFQLAVRDFLILGHGWVKVGYRFVEEESTVEETADEMADPNVVESAIESKLIIVEDRPFIERVDPFCMYVDSDATSMKDIRWIAQKIRRPLNEVKNDKRFNAAAREEVKATSTSSYRDNPGITTMNDSINQVDSYCEIYEYYDIDSGEMCVFADTGDKFLVKPTKIPFAFGHPFQMIRNYDVPGVFYPMGDLEAIEPLQYELNETRTQMMNHRKRFARKYLFKQAAFDDFGRQQLANDDDNAMVPVNENFNLGDVVAPFPAIINPPDFYNLSGTIISDIDRISGISEYQKGVLPEIRRTATEAGIIQAGADARAAEKLSIVERSIAGAAERLIKIAQQYMTEEQTVRILDTPGQWAWVNFDNEYINGDFDFMVEAGSTIPMNESFRRQMALQVVDAMAPFAQAGVVDMRRLAEYVLKTGFGVQDPSALLAAPQPEMAPEMDMEEEMLPPEGEIPMGAEMLPPGFESEQEISPEVLAALQAEQQSL